MTTKTRILLISAVYGFLSAVALNLTKVPPFNNFDEFGLIYGIVTAHLFISLIGGRKRLLPYLISFAVWSAASFLSFYLAVLTASDGGYGLDLQDFIRAGFVGAVVLCVGLIVVVLDFRRIHWLWIIVALLVGPLAAGLSIKLFSVESSALFYIWQISMTLVLALCIKQK